MAVVDMNQRPGTQIYKIDLGQIKDIHIGRITIDGLTNLFKAIGELIKANDWTDINPPPCGTRPPCSAAPWRRPDTSWPATIIKIFSLL